MASKHKSRDDEEVLAKTSPSTEQPEAPEGSKVSERFQASLARFAFAHWHSSNQKVKANGKPTTTPRRPRNHDHSAEKSPDSPLPSSPRVKDLRTRKRWMSVLDEGPNQSVGRLEPGSPSRKQKRGYAVPSTYAHLWELRDHLQSGLEGESIKTLYIPKQPLTFLFSSFLWYQVSLSDGQLSLQ